MENTITAHKITKKFADKTVLNGIDLEIKKGEIFALLGPSGAGKTTFIKILTGQLKPDEGTSTIGGKDSDKLKGEDYRNFGIMMDNFGLYERLSCFDNLKIFARIYKISDEEIHKALENVGLKNAEKTCVSNLSKGMTSRLKLARAFMINPSVLFLDEPTSALDPATTEDIHRIILSEKAKGKTIFLTTHNMNEAEKLSDNIALLCDGNILEKGSPKEICRKYNHQKRIKIHLTDGTDREIPHDSSAIKALTELFEKDLIETIHSTEPDLETVFMELTGKELAR